MLYYSKMLFGYVISSLGAVSFEPNVNLETRLFYNLFSIEWMEYRAGLKNKKIALIYP